MSISRGTDASVRLRSGKVKEVALGTLQPISMSAKEPAPQESDNGTFTHFISVELSEMKRQEGNQLEMYQNMLSIVPGIGKMVDSEKLHFTIAVLRAPDEHDVREVLGRMQEVIKELVNLIEAVSYTHLTLPTILLV